MICPDPRCNEPLVLVGTSPICSTYDLKRVSPLHPACPVCGSLTVTSEGGADLLCIGYDEGDCDWWTPRERRVRLAVA